MRCRAWSLLGLLAIAAAADAQLAPPVRKCIDSYNNKLRLVSQQAGKSARSCLRAAAKGDEPNPDGCIVTNPDGRIAGKQAKVAALYSGGTCTGGEPIQHGAAIGNAAHRDAATDLAHDLFGDPVTAAVIGVASGDARCLDTAMKRAVLALAAITKGHRQCKKAGLTSGAVVDTATLETACGTLAQVDSGGKAQTLLAKLVSDVGTKCATSTAGLATLFPGLQSGCHADATALGTCVAARARCRACLAIATADGQHFDCDLFDDDAANGSCLADPLGTHTCTLDSSSLLEFHNTAFPLNVLPTGALTISCGSPDANQIAACTCSLASFGPLIIPAIGDVCISSAPGCPAGSIDCDGGTARDRQLAADHNIGTCGSNAACASACDAHCAGFGAFTRETSGCEGFCQGGGNNDAACTEDSDCPGGGCVGGNPVFHPGICNCTCDGGGLGAPVGAGHFDCSLGMQAHIELPTDGDCLDASVETLPPRCVGMTTATTNGAISNFVNTPGWTFPVPAFGQRSGAAVSCGALENGQLTGLKLVGQTPLYDTTLGDMLINLLFNCQ